MGPGAGEPVAARRSPAVQLGYLWGAAAVAAAALAPFVPRLLRLYVRAWPRCPVKLLAGIPCPACGSGRATVALGRLDVGRAFVLNPLFTVSALAFVLGGLAALAFASSGRGVREPRTLSRPARAAIVLAVVANWGWLLLDGR